MEGGANSRGLSGGFICCVEQLASKLAKHMTPSTSPMRTEIAIMPPLSFGNLIANGYMGIAENLLCCPEHGFKALLQ